MQEKSFDRILRFAPIPFFRNLLEMVTGLGIGIPVLFPRKDAVTAPDEIIKIFAKFDVVGDIMDALGAIGFFHIETSILN